MNKQQFKQARKTLNLSCDKFAEELGLKGKHRERWIRRLEDPKQEKFQPSKRLVDKVKILLELHEMKKQLLEKNWRLCKKL
jgi:DNA-binding transcriptional regulator YiaG